MVSNEGMCEDTADQRLALRNGWTFWTKCHAERLRHPNQTPGMAIT